jgi:hypothetical protein
MRAFARREVRFITASAITFEIGNHRGVRGSPHSKNSTQITVRRSTCEALRFHTADSLSHSDCPHILARAVCRCREEKETPFMHATASEWSWPDSGRKEMARSGGLDDSGDADNRQNRHRWTGGGNERKWMRSNGHRRESGAKRKEGRTLKCGAAAIETGGRREREAGR